MITEYKRGTSPSAEEEIRKLTVKEKLTIEEIENRLIAEEDKGKEKENTVEDKGKGKETEN